MISPAEPRSARCRIIVDSKTKKPESSGKREERPIDQ